jgi:diaminopimelate decarboxylase
MSWQKLFPLTARVNDAEHLEIGGCDVTALAQEFDTPLYVYDETTLRTQATDALNALRAHWEDATLLYATKAYFAPFLARLYREWGLGLDVTSEAEMWLAQNAGFDPALIYVHGNNKTRQEIRAALAMGVTHFVIDNLDEIARIAESARQWNRTPRLLIRLSPNIDAHTHRYMTTGVADSKFGLGIQNGMAERAAREIARYDNLDLVGLHFHIGSQVFDTDALREALNAVLDVAQAWRTKFDFALRELNIGGGWGVAYNDAQTTLDVPAFIAQTTAALRAGLRARGLNETLKLIAEPGRGLIARAGVALYRVGSVKDIPGVRSYVAVDGGMGDNVRPALYAAQYQAYLANRFGENASREYAIAGRYCEQGDVLIERAALPETRVGDLVAIPVAGAYQIPMASNYNLIPRPAVVLAQNGRARLVRRRETLEDMLACEI